MVAALKAVPKAAIAVPKAVPKAALKAVPKAALKAVPKALQEQLLHLQVQRVRQASWTQTFL